MCGVLGVLLLKASFRKPSWKASLPVYCLELCGCHLVKESLINILIDSL